MNRPELFFALVGALGTDLEEVSAALYAELCAAGYALRPAIRLSQLLHALKPYENLSPGSDYASVKAHMDAGDAVRLSFEHGAALAALAVAEVLEDRKENAAGPGVAWIFRSLKHPAEVELLRTIYGARLTVISVYDSLHRRRQALLLRGEKAGVSSNEAEIEVEKLMERDQHGEDHANPFGQNVRGTFPLADFFVDARSGVRGQVSRLVHLLFGDPGRSPTRDEYGMFTARAAALRSADLSRQVGAAIIDADGEILSVGCNEVPRPGGGIYWEGDDDDHRDYKKGKDANALFGNQVLVEVFQALSRAEWLSDNLAGSLPQELVEAARKERIFEAARISSLIEFGRVVHAEMTALTYAARTGRAVGGARMFSTTFPCHMCARHIIAAGIQQVTYIEPYPKSLAQDLYPEAICLDDDRAGQKVKLQPFIGVAPRRFLDLFEFGKRKDDKGFAQEWWPREATPRLRVVGSSHILIETELSASLLQALKERNWV